MPRTCYSVERLQGDWVVSVSGARILTCKTKCTATKAARRATALLLQGQEEGSRKERRRLRCSRADNQPGSNKGSVCPVPNGTNSC